MKDWKEWKDFLETVYVPDGGKFCLRCPPWPMYFFQNALIIIILFYLLDIAAYIKKEFDKKYNPTWHCIVGRNFGSYVTHETRHFIYFYLGQVAILLFKSGWKIWTPFHHAATNSLHNLDVSVHTLITSST